MRLRWIIPLTILIPFHVSAGQTPVKARTETVVINPDAITPLHLRPGFVSTIRMPEEINSVALGNRATFSADHNEGEPLYVYVKPITKEPAQSNLTIATRSGLHVTLELVSDGARSEGGDIPVDFLLQYRLPHSFLIFTAPNDSSASPSSGPASGPGKPNHNLEGDSRTPPLPASELDAEYQLQTRVNAPAWSKWEGQQIETAIGDIRQTGNRTMVSYSIYNNSDRPVEIVPPQIQISERKKKKKKGPSVLSDQLEVREYRLSATRLEAGERADGVAVFDRPSLKQSMEKLLLQLAQADQVDRPILIPLPFTPLFAGKPR